MARRHYRNSLDFVADAFRACWANAQNLVTEAKLLSDHGHKARALSLSVLALEEIGKLFCADGLLYARPDDQKAKAFAKSLKSHSTKLSALNLLPLLLKNISSVDPRYSTEKRFMQAVVISAQDLKDRGNAVFDLLDGEGFSKLDHWKQIGFYSQPRDKDFITPNEAVRREVSEAVFMLAWRATTTLDFLLKDGNLKRYIDVAREVRATMSEEQHAAMSAAGEELANLLFPIEEDGADGQSLH
jgi:AbiV family abortive infection protein